MTTSSYHHMINGRPIPPLCYGTMSLAHAYGSAGDTPTRLKLLDELHDMGFTSWDTSDKYGDAEDLIGMWLDAHPDKRQNVFIATKGGIAEGSKVDSSPEYIEVACKKSLQRLKTDYIDLYYIHRLDQKTPIEKVMGTLSALKREGKIRAIGLSEVSATTLERACKVDHVDALQSEYSPFCLDIEKLGILEACKKLNIAVFAYSPLGRGFLTGSYKKSDFANDHRGKTPRFAEAAFDRNLQLVGAISKVTESVRTRYEGVTQAQVVLAWIMRQWQGLIPLTGTRSKDRARMSLAAKKIQLTEQEDLDIRYAGEALKDIGDRYPGEVFMSMLNANTPDL